ncbi:MAG: hypothetical protein ACW97X_14485, partial [Candidatus Hodarchaeales archaeon]
KPLDLTNKNFTLFTWVECSNGSIVKLERKIEVFEQEETDSANGKRTTSIGKIISLIGQVY